MTLKVKSKFINADMTDDTELASEASARSSADTTLQTNIDSEAFARGLADTNLQTNITNEATARSNGDSSLQTQITTNANNVSNIVSTFMANVRATFLTGISFATGTDIVATDTVLEALGKIQAKLTAHFGSGGASHADVTQSVDGFMIAADKLKLDNALGRIVFPLIAIATAASNTTFTSVGANFAWIQSRSSLIKSGTIVYYVASSNRRLQLRVVNVDTGAVLAASALIAVSGYYTLSVTLPTTDCKIGLQILKETTGGASPSLEAAQLSFETI